MSYLAVQYIQSPVTGSSCHGDSFIGTKTQGKVCIRVSYLPKMKLYFVACATQDACSLVRDDECDRLELSRLLYLLVGLAYG